jgi:hypothetical protein
LLPLCYQKTDTYTAVRSAGFKKKNKQTSKKKQTTTTTTTTTTQKKLFFTHTSIGLSGQANPTWLDLPGY